MEAQEMRRLLLVATLILCAACMPSTVKTTPNASQSSGGKPASKKETARVGSSITLKGQDNGEQVTVTVLKIVDPAKSSNDYESPDPGKRYVAVQIKIQNSGTVTYDDSPSNGSKLIDSQSQQYDAEISDPVSPGLGSVKMAPGSTRVGYITFQVPNGTKLASFQFGPDSGFAPETGEWQIS